MAQGNLGGAETVLYPDCGSGCTTLYSGKNSQSCVRKKAHLLEVHFLNYNLKNMAFIQMYNAHISKIYFINERTSRMVKVVQKKYRRYLSIYNK